MLIRLEELVPEEAWDALEVSRLQRAIEDESYRDEVLRSKGIVRPGQISCHAHISCSTLQIQNCTLFSYKFTDATGATILQTAL